MANSSFKIQEVLDAREELIMLKDQYHRAGERYGRMLDRLTDNEYDTLLAKIKEGDDHE